MALALVALVLAACDSNDATPTASPSVLPTASAPVAASATVLPSASADPGQGEETSVFDLEIGDCFDASGDQVDTVTILDCDAPHTYEAFAIFDHEGGADAPYPGDEALLEYADSACQPYFEEYVGIAYPDSQYWITSVTPSRETWDEAGDREIVCTLKLGEAGDETTGSAEGSGQ
ncbi:MAG TPA: septum formation family protein [Candidatus Limnocylindria bacterium]|nr:septum formation family protein [Candidatus Limnocylindria bacterium]